MCIETVGILGGMGPVVTNFFYSRILDLTPIKKEQDHLHIIIDSYPQIPDRTSFILNEGENPIPYLKKATRNLEKAGADTIMIPCNTAHYFFNEVSSAVSIPVINMIEEALNSVGENKQNNQLQNLGLLATSGTIKTGLYEKMARKKGINILYPEKVNQQKIMKAIYETKKGAIDVEPVKLLLDVIKTFSKKNIDGIIAGCTEISMLLSSEKISIPYIDPLEILAKKAVKITKKH